MTYILLNNGVYALTKGQASPTLYRGEKTKSMPTSSIQEHLNPIQLALTAGFTWIGRGYAYNLPELTMLLQQAIQHPGLAYLDVLQPCPTYNNLHDKAWYSGKDIDSSQGRLYSLQAEGYDPLIPAGSVDTVATDKLSQCLIKAQQWGNRIPTGIFLRDLSRPSFLDQVKSQYPYYLQTPPARRRISDASGHPLVDMSELFSELGEY